MRRGRQIIAQAQGVILERENLDEPSHAEIGFAPVSYTHLTLPTT